MGVSVRSTGEGPDDVPRCEDPTRGFGD
jgi:hypothetical protein